MRPYRPSFDILEDRVLLCNSAAPSSLLASSQHPGTGNVTKLVTILPGKPQAQPGHSRFQERVVLCNFSETPVMGPLWLVLRHLPRHVHLLHAAGITHVHAPGNPFVVVHTTPDHGLNASMCRALLLQFSNPLGKDIQFTPLLWAGPGPV